MESEKKLDAIKDLAIGNADDASFWKARAQAAEALVVELAGALRDIGQSGPVDKDGNDDAEAGWSWCYDRANAVLDAMPTKVLERARAVDKVVKWARQTCNATNWVKAETTTTPGPGNELTSAIAKLDALGKEKG